VPIPSWRRQHNLPVLLLLKICHYQTTTATSGPSPLILQLFSCCLFCMGHSFFTVWLFLCRLMWYVIINNIVWWYDAIVYCSYIVFWNYLRVCELQKHHIVPCLSVHLYLIKAVVLLKRTCTSTFSLLTQDCCSCCWVLERLLWVYKVHTSGGRNTFYH